MLLCTVRNCHMELVREERRLHCPRGHSFDVARSGYINLLQPQERRSKEPGDTAIARRMRVDRGPAWRIARAATLAELRGWAPLAGIQVEYSLAERTPDPTQTAFLNWAGAQNRPMKR